jgi:hypothetical protein
MQYNRETIIQGLKNQQAAEETPETFATMNGADQSSDMDIPKSRMAGPVGARALQLMNDPAYQAAADGWNAKFALTPQGVQFNQAKMGTMPEQQQPQQSSESK